MDIWTVVVTILGSAGGAGVIIIAASKYFSQILADRYIERVKTDFEIEKASRIRYSSSQFEEYNKLWSSLYDLKFEGDKLWELADERNLGGFSSQLRKTKGQIEKASIFIEEGHYSALLKILDSFGQYQIGKKRLIDIRKNIAPGSVWSEEITDMVNRNGQTKVEYEELISEIRKDLKKQLKG